MLLHICAAAKRHCALHQRAETAAPITSETALSKFVEPDPRPDLPPPSVLAALAAAMRILAHACRAGTDGHRSAGHARHCARPFGPASPPPATTLRLAARRRTGSRARAETMKAGLSRGRSVHQNTSAPPHNSAARGWAAVRASSCETLACRGQRCGLHFFHSALSTDLNRKKEVY